MNPTLQHILVIGGNGFIGIDLSSQDKLMSSDPCTGSAVCKAAVTRGMQVTSIRLACLFLPWRGSFWQADVLILPNFQLGPFSSSGQPYRTVKGHTPAWVHKVIAKLPLTMLLVHVHPIAPLLQSLAAHWLLFHASSTFFSHILRLVCTNTSIDGCLVFEILRFRSILF